MNIMNRIYCNIHTRAFLLSKKMKDKLAENKGSFLTDHAMAIVIVIVIASILLLGLRNMFNNTIIPRMDESANNFFGQAVS